MSVLELPADVEKLASRFIAAVETADFDTVRDEIYTAGTRIWHNTSGVSIDAEENIRRLTWLHSVSTNFRYHEIRRYPIPNGYVQQHTLRLTVVPLGESIEVRACFIVQIENGRIVRLDEYLDSAQSAILDPLRPTN